MAKFEGSGASVSDWPRGAGWRKWDLHVHSPASQGFKGDYEQFVVQLGKADCDVIGINDYFSIQGYREILRRLAASGATGDEGYREGLERLRAKVLLPVVECRMTNILLDKKTASGQRINFHLIFDPALSAEDIETFIKGLHVGESLIGSRYDDKEFLLNDAAVDFSETLTLLERRDAFELMRDQAAEHFERATGSIWRPRSGSRVTHRTLTAAVIDSRDFLAAKRRAETEVMLPAGPKVAVTGGLQFNDHRLIWDVLDRVRAKHSDMVLLHGGSPRGAELIAARWADHRNVSQIAFKPDWTRHGKAAPFQRNDQLLDVLPVGVIVFPGTGIQENLADKARKLGVPVMRFGEGGA